MSFLNRGFAVGLLFGSLYLMYDLEKKFKEVQNNIKNMREETEKNINRAATEIEKSKKLN